MPAENKSGSGSGKSEIWSSSDLTTWSRVAPVTDQWALAHVTRVNERFYAFTTWLRVLTSTDGTSWSSATVDTFAGAVAFGNGRYLVVGSGLSRSQATGWFGHFA